MRIHLCLALVWFCYFLALGCFFPFFSLYLRENAGLSGDWVGVVQAVFPAVAIVAQPLWGQIADRTGERSRVLVAVTLGAALGYAALGQATGLGALLGAAVLLAAFASAVVPGAVSVTFAALRDAGGGDFGRVRVWGTLGFLAAIVGFPRLLDGWQAQIGAVAVPGGVSEPGLELLFPVAAASSLLAVIAGLGLPRTGSLAARSRPGEGRRLLGHRPVVRLLLFAFLSFLALQGPMVLFPVFVRSIGGDIDTVARMWIVMLVVEIPLLATSGRGLRRVGPRGLLAAGIAAAAIRWLVCAVATTPAPIYAVQLLHGVTVAGILLGGPVYLEAAVPARLRSTAQSLFSMCGVGLGGILSNVVAGHLLEASGARAPYLAGGLLAAVVAVAAPWLLPPPAAMAERGGTMP